MKTLIIKKEKWMNAEQISKVVKPNKIFLPFLLDKEIIKINDSQSMSLEERKKLLIDEFKKNDVELVFVDSGKIMDNKTTLAGIIAEDGFFETLRTLQAICLEQAEEWRKEKRIGKARDYETIYERLETPVRIAHKKGI